MKGHFAAFLILSVLSQSKCPSKHRERTQVFAGRRALRGGSSNSSAAFPGFVADPELVLNGHLLLITAL